MRVADDVAVYRVPMMGSQDFGKEDRMIIQKEASLICTPAFSAMSSFSRSPLTCVLKSWPSSYLIPCNSASAAIAAISVVMAYFWVREVQASVAVLVVTTSSAMGFMVLKMRSLSAHASCTSHSLGEGILEYHFMAVRGVVVLVVLPALLMGIVVGSGVSVGFSVGFWIVLSR